MACARHAHIPLCNLGRDALTTLIDVTFARTLQVGRTCSISESCFSFFGYTYHILCCLPLFFPLLYYCSAYSTSCFRNIPFLCPSLPLFVLLLYFRRVNFPFYLHSLLSPRLLPSLFLQYYFLLPL